MNMNLNLYKYFYVVAKHESFTKAAEIEKISQPSLSYNVKVLEEQLQVKLFERCNNKIILTEKGKELYNILQLSFSHIKNFNINKTIKIIVGAEPCVLYKVIPKISDILGAIYETAIFEFKPRENNELENSLLSGDVDLVLGTKEYLTDNTNFISILIENKFVGHLACSTENYKEIKKNKSMKKALLNYTVGYNMDNKLDGDFEKYFLPNTKFKHCNDELFLIDDMVNNNVVGFISKIIIEKEIKHGLIKILDFPEELPKYNLVMTMKKDIYNNISVLVKQIEDIVDYVNHN